MTHFNKKKKDYFSEEFSQLNLSGHEINQTTFEECGFNDCDLSGTCFKKCSFIDCRFNGTDLTGANFTEAINYTINIMNNKIKNAKFSRFEAIRLLEGLEIELID